MVKPELSHEEAPNKRQGTRSAADN